MKKDVISNIKARLEAEKTRLENELKEISTKNPRARVEEDFDATWPNLGDKEDENAEEVNQFSTNLTLERTLESSLRDIDKALDRITKGNYGVCKYCGKEIDEKRLMARPESSSCVSCKKSFTQEM
ncbi:TraR/DksA C4-type zinc finger protein [Candidatus Uhrbacteria bacterium]|nr:TraR/DksA C4-type zinc finger protein [Candidatus Uhrbacteria bacterium]